MAFFQRLSNYIVTFFTLSSSSTEHFVSFPFPLIPKMRSSSINGFLMICAISASCLALSSSTGDRHFLHLPPESACRSGLESESVIAECMLGGGDAFQFAAEFEISRRILAMTRRYISYGAMRRNSVPCSRRGASYYNCRLGSPANPYSRGCSAIARCRWYMTLMFLPLKSYEFDNCLWYYFTYTKGLKHHFQFRSPFHSNQGWKVYFG